MKYITNIKFISGVSGEKVHGMKFSSDTHLKAFNIHSVKDAPSTKKKFSDYFRPNCLK